MASQTITLGSLSALFDDYFVNVTVQLDSALVQGGGTGWFRRFTWSGGSDQISLNVSSTSSETPGTAGPDFTEAVENYASAFTFSYSGGTSIVLKGPNHPDITSRDMSEPYAWTPDNASEFETWLGNVGSNSVTLVIDDGVFCSSSCAFFCG